MTAARPAAWTLFIAFVVSATIATVAGLNRIAPDEPIGLVDALWAWSFIGFPFTGALIVGRLPRRPLGWIFLVAPLLVMTGVAFSEFAAIAVAKGGEAALLSWSSNAIFSLGVGAMAYVPLLLPDGRLPSPAWRPFVGVLVSASVLGYLVTIFAPGPLLEFSDAHNPFGMAFLEPLADPVADAVGPLWLGTLLVGIGALLFRLRRARGEERLQIRWVALGGATIVAAILGTFLVERIFGDLSDTVVTIPVIVSIVAFPIAIGIAILKHRLYDIGVVVNRALVYAVLTLVLVAAYAGGVLLFRTVLDPLTGDNDFAIAASTLAVAALFGPARRRTQIFIDRRFYRSRYDARQILARFGTRLRDEVELDVVAEEMLRVCRRTVQPAHVAITLVRRSGS